MRFPTMMAFCFYDVRTLLIKRWLKTLRAVLLFDCARSGLWCARPAIAALALFGVTLLGAIPDVAHAADLTLVCPGDGSSVPVTEPMLEDQSTGQRTAITDPQLKAVAMETCSPGNVAGANSVVKITNKRDVSIFVSFTTSNHKQGPITWGGGCEKLAPASSAGSASSTGGVMIRKGVTCTAKVNNNAVSSRFCAALDQPPADCYNAQANHQTMVETIFEPGSNPGCFNKGYCVWFDISVIPSTCTDDLWKLNQCANTGGASYNLPVSVSCGSKPVYACQGPTSGKYGSANYPANCGNPDATCSGTPACLNAYFYPMFDPPENKYQPNTVCLGGQTLTLTFLPGQ
ncbi:hypothetical protein CR492_18895 [Methylocella silvestris]|uniref:Uncharacterized protein n=2 Tax=Methylocella silvestris TaxID=199596 RepID=A0A2J7TCE2_METSI|nr:hypothetical protein CR492_18895 [Methylocella silvestris]